MSALWTEAERAAAEKYGTVFTWMTETGPKTEAELSREELIDIVKFLARELDETRQRSMRNLEFGRR